MHRLPAIARRIVGARAFEYFIILVILAGATLIGFGTSDDVSAQYGDWLILGNQIVVAVFILEAALKMTALYPRPVRGYFRNWWNVFDFTIIVLSLLPVTGSFAMAARLGRMLRVLHLISSVRGLRVIVAALVRSIPSVGYIIILMSILVYVYSVTGYYLFNDIDPENWGSLGLAALSILQMVTLDDWAELMHRTIHAHAFGWVYFVSFIVIATFIVLNLFIAIVINNLNNVREEREHPRDGAGGESRPARENLPPPSYPA